MATTKQIPWATAPGLGVLYGQSMGEGWARMTTEPECPEHGLQTEDF